MAEKKRSGGSSGDVPIGPIIIARHGKPALNRNEGPKLDWKEYVDWWARYEDGGLAEGQDAPQALKDAVADAAVYLVSPRRRAMETAQLAAPGKDFQVDPLFIEAPLPPPRYKRKKFLPRRWNVLARTAWMFGHVIGDEEDIKASRKRAREGARHLHDAAREGKVFLAAHGWFNRMMRPELRRLGWRCTHDGGDKYWSYRVYEYRGR